MVGSGALESVSARRSDVPFLYVTFDVVMLYWRRIIIFCSWRGAAWSGFLKIVLRVW